MIFPLGLLLHLPLQEIPRQEPHIMGIPLAIKASQSLIAYLEGLSRARLDNVDARLHHKMPKLIDHPFLLSCSFKVSFATNFDHQDRGARCLGSAESLLRSFLLLTKIL